MKLGEIRGKDVISTLTKTKWELPPGSDICTVIQIKIASKNACVTGKITIIAK